MHTFVTLSITTTDGTVVHRLIPLPLSYDPHVLSMAHLVQLIGAPLNVSHHLTDWLWGHHGLATLCRLSTIQLSIRDLHGRA